MQKVEMMQKAGAAAVFWGCGDLLTQALEARLTKRKDPFDYKRALVTGAYGCFFVTPLASMWYGPWMDGGIHLLKKVLPQSKALVQRWSEPQNHMKMSLLQSGLTFTCVAPVLASAYVGWNGIFYKGSKPEVIKSDLKAQFLPIMRSDFLFWPIADCLNFRFAPPALRFYIMLGEDMIWSAILSMWGNHLDDVCHFKRATDEVASFTLIGEAMMSASPLNLYTLAALRMLDIKHNGVVDRSELTAFVGITDAHVDFDEISGGKEVIDLESLTMFLEQYPHSTLALLIQFRMMDLDGNGVVTKQEMRAVVGEKRVQTLFDQVDANHDGVVSFEEFMAHEAKVSTNVIAPLLRRPSVRLNCAQQFAAKFDAHGLVEPKGI